MVSVIEYIQFYEEEIRHRDKSYDQVLTRAQGHEKRRYEQ